MRFAERCLPLLAPLLLAPLVLSLALSGCTSLQEPLKTLQEAVTPSAAKAPAPAASAATVPAPAPVIAAPVDTAPPLSPQVQRDFDNARRLLAAGRSADAERAFAALAQAHPELGGAHANLGLIYRQAGKPGEAVAALEKAVQVSPRQPLYFNQLGIAYRQAGQFNKARGAYERAIELDENYAAAVLNLGILHDIYLRDAKRALELYERYQVITAGKDATVTRWVAELKNRKPEPGNVLVKKEQP